MVAIWYQYGSNMVEIWQQYGSSMVEHSRNIVLTYLCILQLILQTYILNKNECDYKNKLHI